MMLSLQEISDQLQIQQNLWDYANAVDLKDFDLLDQVFLPDAEIFYGDQYFNREQAKQWLRESLQAEQIGGYYHLMGSMRIAVKDDRAISQTRCFNPMEIRDEQGNARLWLNGLWYRWLHRRTAEGWRIVKRLAEDDGSYRVFGWTTPPFDEGETGPPA